MSRDRFISDNLYSMRERFKRNHEENVSVSTIPEELMPAEKPAPAPAQEPVTVSRISCISTTNANSEIVRDIRELEGRLLRDLSFIDAENEIAQQRNKTLSNFRETALNVLDKLKQEQLDTKEIDRLRSTYFQAYGRFEARFELRKNQKSSSVELPCPPAAPQAVWPVVVAILLSGGLVALTLLLLFGR